MRAQRSLESSRRASHLEQMRALDCCWEEVSQSIQRARQQVAIFQRCLANARHILSLEAAETASPSAILVKRVAWLEQQVVVTEQRLQELCAEQDQLAQAFDAARRQLANLQRQACERRAQQHGVFQQRVARCFRSLRRGLVLTGHLLLCGSVRAKPPEGITWEGGLYWW